MVDVVKKILENSRGFSLIEIIAALVILTIILSSFMSIFLVGVKTKVSSTDTVTGIYSTQSELEDLLAFHNTTTDYQTFKNRLVSEKGYNLVEVDSDHYAKVLDDQLTMELEMKEAPSNYEQWGGTVRLAVLTLNNSDNGTMTQKVQSVLIWE